MIVKMKKVKYQSFEVKKRQDSQRENDKESEMENEKKK